MTINATRLRENIYRILDQILETGIPVQIERRGKILKIVPGNPKSKFDNLVRRNAMKEDPQDYIHIDWSREWKP